MKRRLLPILMTLVLVCALPIWAAFVTSGDVTNPLLTTAAASEMALQERINQANAGATITLNSNTEIAATLQITKNLTLDLNGHVLKMTGDGSVLKVSGRATLTIQDSSAEGTGTITGGNAVDGGGVYIDNNATLKMTGGCITGCHASYGGGGIRSSGNLYMSGTAKIEKCTSNWGSDDAIWNKEGVIYADGGTVDGMVNNQGTIKRSEGAAAVTVFNGAVYNQQAGTIEAGMYNETVENNGTIIGGTFYGGVTIRKGSWVWERTGSVTGGTFYGPIVNEVGPGQVTGGTFAVRFDTGDGTKPEPELVPWNDKVLRPTSDPEKSGHTFVGWYLGDALYDFDTPVNAPLTLTARWEEVPSSGGYYYYPTTDTKADDAKGSPKTADPGAALYGALALLSLTGLTCTARKKF
jgi:uncharacterized repeat protein (TIGR02543 family)